MGAGSRGTCREIRANHGHGASLPRGGRACHAGGGEIGFGGGGGRRARRIRGRRGASGEGETFGVWPSARARGIESRN